MEEKVKSKNTTKKTTTKKSVPKKGTTNKGTTKKVTTKPQTKKVSSNKPTTTKKVKTASTKKVQSKQVTKSNKTVQTKKPVVKQVPKKKEPTKEELLERTLIFDGRENKNLTEVVEKLENENVVLEDKVIKRSKVKKVIIIILTALIAAVIAATTIYVVYGEMKKAENNQTLNSNIYRKVANNYKTISDIKESQKSDAEDSIEEIKYSNIKTLTLADFERKVLEKEDMVILISSTTCYHCITFEPTINEVLVEQNKNIYRINITAFTKEEDARFRTYYAYTIAPTIFTVKDGFASAEITGTISKEELSNWIKENA